MRTLTPSIRRVLQSIDISPDLEPMALRLALCTTASGLVRPNLGSGTKTELGESLWVKTAVQYLSPAKEAGINTCPWASRGCAEACLGHSAGNLRFSSNQRVRIKKTLFRHLFPESYHRLLHAEIALHAEQSRAIGMTPAVRLNGSSDILWERHVDMASFEGVQFYDYTKARAGTRENRPSNYHLTYSLHEGARSMEYAKEWLRAGGNAAVVVAAAGSSKRKDAKRVARQLVASGWQGFPCIDGDLTDVRFRDQPGSWVVLYAKGDALKDSSGFVVRF